MNSHKYEMTCVVVLTASLLLFMSAAESRSNVLFSEAFGFLAGHASNHCIDARCLNVGEGSQGEIQNNKCYHIESNSGCLNTGTGGGTIDNNHCSNGRNGCTNEGNGIQSNNCSNVQGECLNAGFGGTQSNHCYNQLFGGCENVGSGGNKNNKCYQTDGCFNVSKEPNFVTQSNLCQKTSCTNDAGSIPSNIQDTKCSNAGTCSNTGDHTTVIGVNSPCSSSGAHSTTICTSGRTVVKQH